MRQTASALAMHLLAVAALVVGLPTGQAAGGHDGPEPVETALFLHFVGQDRIPMQTMPPQRFELAPSSAAPSGCGAAIEWNAVLTLIPVGDEVTWTEGLGREAEFGLAAPRLTWFIETTRPGGVDPLPLPVDTLRLRAELRTGNGADEQGRLLAAGATDAARDASVAGRFVHRFDLAMAWQNRSVQAPEGLQLQVWLDAGAEPCRWAPAGIRAFAGPDHLPTLSLRVFDPVRIDLLEPRPLGDAWVIAWHASSPWGRFDLAEPQPPQVLGPGGKAAAPRLLDVGPGHRLETLWQWRAEGPNGTYRIDATIENAAGTATGAAQTLFQVGSPSAAPVHEAPPEHKSPAGWPVTLTALVAGGALAMRRRS